MSANWFSAFLEVFCMFCENPGGISENGMLPGKKRFSEKSVRDSAFGHYEIRIAGIRCHL